MRIGAACVFAVFVGFAAWSARASAQPELTPFRVGDTVTVVFTPQWSRECRIEEQRGTFIRCRNSAGVRGEYWVNVAQAGGIQKLPPGAGEN